jgi:polar amino acid transport system permease protein
MAGRERGRAGSGVSPDRPVSEIQLRREEYRRGRTRRSTLIALVSTLAFAALCAATLLSSPGWSRVQEQFFDLEVARDSLPRILSGLWLNIRVLVVAAVCVLILGLTIAALRTLRGPVFFPVRAVATVYTDLFRGMPLIIVLYLIGFGVPGLRLQGVPTSPVILGTVALVLTYSAYVAEVFRAGIESVHPSQRAAARSLGLSYRQSMRLVVLPQAVRRVTPPLLNDFVAMQKDVGLISVLGAVDAVRAAQIESAGLFDFTPYVVAGLLFVLLAVPSARVADWYATRAVRREQAGAVL